MIYHKWFTYGLYDSYENIKVKLLIYDYQIKTMTYRNFYLQKENDCKI